MTSCAVAGSAACSYEVPGRCARLSSRRPRHCSTPDAVPPRSSAATPTAWRRTTTCRPWSCTVVEARLRGRPQRMASSRPGSLLSLSAWVSLASPQASDVMCLCFLSAMFCIHMVVHMKSREIDLFYIHLLCWFWLTVELTSLQFA